MTERLHRHTPGAKERSPDVRHDALREIPCLLSNPAFRWREKYEAACQVGPLERRDAAQRLLVEAQETFADDDPRIAMSLELLADARIAFSGKASEGDILLFRRACAVFERGEERDVPISHEHFRVQAKAAHYSECISGSDSELAAVAEYQKVVKLLARYDIKTSAPQHAFQVLSIVRRATDLFFGNLNGDYSVIASALRVTAKSLGLGKIRDIDALTELPAFTRLPHLYRAALFGVQANFYLALGEEFKEKTEAALKCQIKELREALKEYKPILNSEVPKLLGGESSFEREIKKEELFAFERLAYCLIDGGEFERANLVIQNAADLKIPGEIWFREGLLQLAADLRDAFENQNNHVEVAKLWWTVSRILIEGDRIEEGLEALWCAQSRNCGCGETEESKKCCREGLGIIADQPPAVREKLKSLEARFLWAEAVFREQDGELSENSLEFSDEEAVLLRLVKLTFNEEGPENIDAHFVARRRLIEMYLSSNETESAEGHLDACIQLLGGDSGDAIKMRENTSLKAHRVFGVLCQAFNDDRKRTGRILLLRGLEIARNSEQTPRSELFGLLDGLAHAAVKSGVNLQRGLTYADEGLALYHSPDQSVPAKWIADLMRVKAQLLERLGCYQDLAEFERELTAFCERYNLAEPEDED